ncbi:MAG: prepilin-type N-terminal cleavage/methylation domain-containing protein [Candidatus Omnitrophota bacterium]
MKRKGFTLVELLMVVIIIGILVTIAVPSYFRSIERTKGGKAKAGLRAITNAQIQYRALQDQFTAAYADLTDVDLPDDYLDGDDGDWTYASVATPSTVVTTASRIAGPYSGQMVTMDQDGTYDNAAGAGPQEWN